jgi:hypothetical protein
MPPTLPQLHRTLWFALVLGACGGPPEPGAAGDGPVAAPEPAAAAPAEPITAPHEVENKTSAPRDHAPPPESAPAGEVEPGQGRSPEQLGKAIFEGFEDLSVVPSLYPTDALLRRALDCQDEEIYEGIAAMRAKAPSEMGARPAGTKLVHLSTSEAEGFGAAELHPPGSEISGCVAKMEVELRVHSLEHLVINLKGSEQHVLVMLFVRFGDYGWYVFE